MFACKKTSDDFYSVNIYNYKCNSLKMCIYARTLSTAEQIKYLENQYSSFYWKPVIFNFIKKTKTTIPPYELEQMQFDEATKKLNYRKNHYKNNAN